MLVLAIIKDYRETALRLAGLGGVACLGGGRGGSRVATMELPLPSALTSGGYNAVDRQSVSIRNGRG